MTRLVQFDLEDGSGESIYIEVDEKLAISDNGTENNEELEGLIGIEDEVIRKASQTLNKALATIKPIANVIYQEIQNIDKPADEVEVKFGIKLGGQVGSVIAFGNAETNFEITLKWNKKDNPA